MIEEFDVSTILVRDDGSYVVNGGLYHVPNEGEFADLWQAIDAYAVEHPEVVRHDDNEPIPMEA